MQHYSKYQNVSKSHKYFFWTKGDIIIINLSERELSSRVWVSMLSWIYRAWYQNSKCELQCSLICNYLMLYYDTNNGKHDQNNVAIRNQGTTSIKTFVLRELYFEIQSRNTCLLWNSNACYYAQRTPPFLPLRYVTKLCLHSDTVFL